MRKPLFGRVQSARAEMLTNIGSHSSWVCDDFVLRIVLMLVIGGPIREHDYDHEHERSVGSGTTG